MHVRLSALALSVGLLALSACDLSESLSPADAAYLVATLDSGVQSRFEGTGEFDTGSNPARGVEVQFFLDSRGVGASAGERIIFSRAGGGRLGSGTYILEGSGEEGSRLEGLTAAYLRQTVGVAERYVATSGELVVTESSPDRMEGRFRFTAALSCVTRLGENNVVLERAGSCGTPSTPLPEQPGVVVTGSFVAVPATYEGLVARPGT